jgi:hypothetical protein
MRFLKRETEEEIEVKERQGRRCKQLLYDLKKTRGYLKLKDQALDGSLWKTRFGSGGTKNSGMPDRVKLQTKQSTHTAGSSLLTHSPRH